MKIKGKICSNYDLIGRLLIIVGMFLVMLHYAGGRTFWVDEISEISFIQTKYSFADTLKIYANLGDAAPPFFTIFLYFWYRITPYGDRWLLLLPMAATLVSAWMIGLTGKKLYGKLFGILSMILFAVNAEMYCGVAFEIRQYAFLIMISSIVFYIYVCRLQKGTSQSWGMIIGYAVSLALLPYTHYLSICICAALFFADLFLIYKKRISAKALWSYLIGAALFFPWIMIVLLNRRLSSGLTFWPEVPDWSDCFQIPAALAAQNMWLTLLLLLGIAWILYKCIFALFKRNCADTKLNYLPAIWLWVCCFMVFVIFFYSSVINPEGSLYVPRYFYSLIPCSIFIIGYMIKNLSCIITHLFSDRLPSINRNIILYICLSILLVIGTDMLATVQTDATTYSEPFDEEYDLLRNEYDIRDPSVGVVCTIAQSTAEGLTDYYGTHKGTTNKNILDIISAQDEDGIQEIKEAGFSKIYFMNIHVPVNPDFQAYLDENYDLISDDFSWQLLTYVKKGTQ